MLELKLLLIKPNIKQIQFSPTKSKYFNPMLLTYSTLLAAILLEVVATLLLVPSQNFTKIVPTVILAICYIVSFYLLTITIKTLPIAVVYATWSGLGIFTITILGYLLFNQSLNWQAIMGLFLIVLGVIVLNLYTPAIQ